MTTDTAISELELVVLGCSILPVHQEELLNKVAACWTSSSPPPTSTSLFAAMSVRENGYLSSPDSHVFITTPSGRRLLQRALCGALGAPRSTTRPGALSFPQAMAMASLLPAPTLVTVLRTRLDALDRRQAELAAVLRASHERGDAELHIASLNLREGLLNAERAFLFTVVRDIEDGFVTLDGEPVTPSPFALPVP